MQNRLMIAGLLVLSVTGAIWVVSQAAPTSQAGAVWHQIMYDGVGMLRAARGLDRHGNPLTMTMRSRTDQGRLRARIEFTEAGERLNIERDYEQDRSLFVRFLAGGKALEVRAHRNDGSGDFMVSYGLSDGTVYTMWTDPEGTIKDGDMRALKRVVSLGSGVPDILPVYLRSRRPLRTKLPMTGEEFLFYPGLESCEEMDEEFCRDSCHWECANGSCNICRAVCRIGKQVGCSD